MCVARQEGGAIQRWRVLLRTSMGDKEPGVHLIDTFGRDGATRFASKIIFDQLIRRPGDLDVPGQALGFHAAGGGGHLSPEVVLKLLVTDHPGYHRPRIDADAKAQAAIIWHSSAS